MMSTYGNSIPMTATCMYHPKVCAPSPQRDAWSHHDHWTFLDTHQGYYQAQIPTTGPMEINDNDQQLRNYYDNVKEKRRSNGYKHVPHKNKPPQIVAKRNARERRRVQAVNKAFVRLRQAVPIENKRGKRISKVKTLHYAIEYIQILQRILKSTEDTQYHLTNDYAYTNGNYLCQTVCFNGL